MAIWAENEGAICLGFCYNENRKSPIVGGRNIRLDILAKDDLRTRTANLYDKPSDSDKKVVRIWENYIPLDIRDIV